MPYLIRLEQLSAQSLAVVRRKAKQAELPRVVPEACGLVWQAIRAQGLRGGRHVSVYYDGEINLEVGVEMDVPFTPSGEVIASATPAGRVAATTHLGPYGQLGPAHAAIVQWCAANGHSLAGPSWEIYGHWQDAWNNDPSQIATEVVYLLA
jgi:effector-binding domain-containing protein